LAFSTLFVACSTGGERQLWSRAKMMMGHSAAHPTVSVIIPLYNAEAFLAQAIERECFRNRVK
jgi:hypothetical protein